MAPKSVEIDGYVFVASGVTTKRKNNSICYYKEKNVIKVGLIEFFIEVEKEIFVAYIRPMAVKPINEKLKGSKLLQNFQTLPLYYVLEQNETSSEPVVTEAKNIFKKGFSIEDADCTYIIPIIHVYEHN